MSGLKEFVPPIDGYNQKDGSSPTMAASTIAALLRVEKILSKIWRLP